PRSNTVGHHIGTIVAANRREKAGRLESLGVAGSLASKGFQDYSGLCARAKADNSIPAASTIAKFLALPSVLRRRQLMDVEGYPTLPTPLGNSPHLFLVREGCANFRD